MWPLENPDEDDETPDAFEVYSPHEIFSYLVSKGESFKKNFPYDEEKWKYLDALLKVGTWTNRNATWRDPDPDYKKSWP